MKKITVLLILALSLSLASCVATKVDEEKTDDVKTETEQNDETATPSDLDDGELPELPWADGPVETPMIPPEFMDGDIPTESEVPETPVEPTEPEQTEGPALDDKELPILQIVPEENETPAIPIN